MCYEFFTNVKDAAKLAAEVTAKAEHNYWGAASDLITKVEIKPTKKGILNALNNWASH